MQLPPHPGHLCFLWSSLAIRTSRTCCPCIMLIWQQLRATFPGCSPSLTRLVHQKDTVNSNGTVIETIMLIVKLSMFLNIYLKCTPGSCIVDCLTEKVRERIPWQMMFADNVVLCANSPEKLKASLEKWRAALEMRGLKISRKKPEYPCPCGEEAKKFSC